MEFANGAAERDTTTDSSGYKRSLDFYLEADSRQSTIDSTSIENFIRSTMKHEHENETNTVHTGPNQLREYKKKNRYQKVGLTWRNIS